MNRMEMGMDTSTAPAQNRTNHRSTYSFSSMLQRPMEPVNYLALVRTMTFAKTKSTQGPMKEVIS